MKPIVVDIAKRGVVAALLCAALLCAAVTSDAQQAASLIDLQKCPTAAGRPTPLGMGQQLTGLVGCATCHGQAAGQSGGLLGQLTPDPWVLSNEQKTWETKGRHYQAYAALLTERSKAMGRALGVDDVAAEPSCLACHASAPIEWFAERDAVKKILGSGGLTGKSSLLTLGVSCEACHGASGAWNPRHQPPANALLPVPDQWRHLPASQKQEEFGYYDVRSPSSRTRMCVSCHIGDPQRGRLVTHEMYAAGHPPLPAFEIETFLRDMPPHWRTLGTQQTDTREDRIEAKGAELTEAFLANTQEPYFQAFKRNDEAARRFDARYERTRALTIGAIVTWAQSARVTAEAAGNLHHPVTRPDESWPELAQFECAACHHDLSLAGWRARRVPSSTPGRPMLRDWASPLFEAVIGALDGATVPPDVVAGLAFFDTATKKDPYGDASQITATLTAAADAADDWAEALEDDPENAVATRDHAERLLERILRIGTESSLDYESMRSLLWAVEELVRELDPERGWRDVEAQIAAAKSRFVADLASEKVRSAQQSITAGGINVPTREVKLGEVLGVAAEHDGFTSQEVFARLRETVGDELNR